MTNAALKSSDVFDEDRTLQVSELSQKVFGKLPNRVAFPGGKTRAAFIADMGDKRYVFAKRENAKDAQLEGIILRNLGATGHVPKLKSVMNDWVVQEFIAGIRLPVLIDQTEDMKVREDLVSNSLESLVHIHEAAHDVNLQHRMPKVGTADNWLWNRTGAAKRISRSIGIKPPELDRERLVKLMDVKRDEFVKWDARPGNAMVSETGVIWFDWEDCGRSKALDDLAFVLCDEWTALDADAETRLKDRYFPLFNKTLSYDQGFEYLHLFGITHMVLRLRMAQKLFARKDEWWDREYCLQGDKVGVTATEFTRLIHRGKRWAEHTNEWKSLIPWLDRLSDHYKL